MNWTRGTAITPNFYDEGVTCVQSLPTCIPTSAESILTLKNRESIHFCFLLRGFLEKKELIHDT